MNPPSPVTATTRRCGYKELRRYRARHGNPHGGESVGNDAGVRRLAGKHSRHPEFMGAHVAHHHIIVSEHSAKLVHDVLGAHRPRQRTSELGLKPVSDRLPGLPGP